MRLIVIVLLPLCLTIKAFPQGNLSVHAGTSVPLAGFKNSNLQPYHSGAAAVGVDLGLKYVYQFPDSKFGILGEIDIIYNGLQKDYKDKLEKRLNPMDSPTADLKFHKYFNFPIVTGLNYTRSYEKFGFFINAGFALDFLKVTKTEVHVNDKNYSESAGIATNIGYKAGAGIILKQKLSLSVNYLAIGEQDIKSTIDPPGIYNYEIFPGRLKIDMLTVNVGWNLK